MLTFVLFRLLLYNPLERFTAKECLNHDFITPYASPMPYKGEYPKINLMEYFQYEHALETLDDWKNEMLKEGNKSPTTCVDIITLLTNCYDCL